MTKLTQSLLLCKKAGKLLTGFDVVKKSVLEGKAFLLVLASDISSKTEKEVMFLLKQSEVEYIKTSISMDEYWYLVGKRAGVMAVVAANFSDMILSLSENNTQITEEIVDAKKV